MQRFLIQLFVSALAVLAAGALFAPRIQVSSAEGALVFALVLGLCNAVVRPLLLLLTCPLNLITLGLFTFVVNGLVFWIATNAPTGVAVDGFPGAFLGALTVSIASLLAGRIARRQQ